jgi:hypothetical protein
MAPRVAMRRTIEPTTIRDTDRLVATSPRLNPPYVSCCISGRMLSLIRSTFARTSTPGIMMAREKI